ncbi:hypothetical protein HPT25_07695 [Bacillus sp. BRMEA1]|uniref:hypothetical protein n=1 Tax=Neobacillus endophyticus TaxID=2738405 RepID=UPI001565A7DE|nr:hypothetical protein [Neobacillus endophyticus]NRD77381.1 hypothetical protein [Neobacillus endophyticus]
MMILLLNIVCVIFSFFVGFVVNKVLNKMLIFLKDDTPVINKNFILKFIVPCYMLSYSVLSFILGYRDPISKFLQIIFIISLISYFLMRFIKINQKERQLKGFKKDIEGVILAWIDELNSHRKNINYKMNIYFEGRRIRGNVTIDVPADINLPNEKINYLEQELWSKEILVYIQKKSLKILGI